MAVEIVDGDIFGEPVSDMLTDAVNCRGVSGAGLALAFKKRFPAYQKAYAEAAKTGNVRLGKVWVYETSSLMAPRWIVSFPTVHHWNDTADPAIIKKGLQHYRRVIEESNPRSVSVPALGCGLGGADWDIVSETIQECFEGLDANIKLFMPR